MSKNLQIGEVVVLKSGGPLMTIHGIGNYEMSGFNPGILCVWFDANKKVEDVFHADALEKYQR